MLRGTRTSKLISALLALASVCLSQVVAQPTIKGPAGPTTILAQGSEVPGSAQPDRTQLRRSGSYGKLPLVFERNQGQLDQTVKFLSRAAGYKIFLTETGATFQLRRAGKKNVTLNMGLAGANPQPRIGGLEQLPGQTNYYTREFYRRA